MTPRRIYSPRGTAAAPESSAEPYCTKPVVVTFLVLCERVNNHSSIHDDIIRVVITISIFFSFINPGVPRAGFPRGPSFVLFFFFCFPVKFSKIQKHADYIVSPSSSIIVPILQSAAHTRTYILFDVGTARSRHNFKFGIGI